MAEATEALESALSSAFGAEELPKAPPVEPPEAEDAPEVEAEAEQPEGDEQEEAVEAVAEPEYEVEVEGVRETIRGNDKVKEILAKGLHYTKNSEAVAREREAVVAASKQTQVVQHIQNSLANDIAELRNLDAQLEQWSRVDWAAAYDTDPFNALKLREQRDQTREFRAAKFAEFQHKSNQAAEALRVADHQRLFAEEQALVAKLPEWRNSEKALAEAGEVKRSLTQYGFTPTEIASMTDHRQMLVARKAHLYDQLMAGKGAKLKQVRDAPQTVRPGAVAAQPNGRTEFGKAKAKLKELGSKGNHRAQEDMATRMFERAFK